MESIVLGSNPLATINVLSTLCGPWHPLASLPVVDTHTPQHISWIHLLVFREISPLLVPIHPGPSQKLNFQVFLAVRVQICDPDFVTQTHSQEIVMYRGKHREPWVQYNFCLLWGGTGSLQRQGTSAQEAFTISGKICGPCVLWRWQSGLYKDFPPL